MSRTTAVVAGTAALVALGGVGAATASGEIGSGGIQDDSVRSRDIHDGTIRKVDINDNAVQDFQRGVKDPITDGPYTNVWKADGGKTLQEAVVKCDPGMVAIGGGFSGDGGADDLGNPSDKDLQIVTSAPYTDNYQPVNDRGSFTPNEWVVKGFNNSDTTDHIVRPWVTCASE